jgi:hypothetical protein
MITGTPVTDWVKISSTNLTQTTFATLTATTTKPSGSGVIDASAFPGVARTGIEGTSIGANSVVLQPFGAGSADGVFDLRVTGWNKLGSTWIPRAIAQFACTMGTEAGISGGDVTTTDLFCDGITQTWGSAGVDVVQNTSNLSAYAVVDVNGAELVQVTADLGSNATGANALMRWL